MQKECYKAERLKKSNIDQMIEDASRMPIPELRKRYGFSSPFIFKILKEQGVTPKKRWGEMSDAKHKDGSSHRGWIATLSIEPGITVRPKYG